MGVQVDDAGISVQIYSNDGTPKGAPIYGRFAFLAGQKQEDVIRTRQLTPEEKGEPGSVDWLTLIAVADTRERLDAILTNTAVSPLGTPHSSHSSRRVLVELHVGDNRQTFRNCATIASGPILSLVPDDVRIKVAHVKVVPDGKQMVAGHPLFPEFRGGKPAVE